MIKYYSIKEAKAPLKAERFFIMEKEFLYVGHYIDINGNYILKVGTTNNLKRRQSEHNRAYRRTPHHPMPSANSFIYDWYLPLSKYNTLRYEDKTKSAWKSAGFGKYLNNDRFVCAVKPEAVEITIRKTYKILL